MQAWNQVQVVKAGDPFEGRAGVVIGVDGEAVTVRVDAQPDGSPALEAAFLVEDLKILA